MAAYHETHDAPHCPTCDCGVESLSRSPIAEGGGDVLPVLREVLALLKNTKELQGREHVSLGIRFNAAIESLSRQGGDSRCPHCDDTGDVHTADGEWHGVCSCPAGDKIGKDAPPKTRASEAWDCPDGFVLVRKEAIDWLNGESDFECPPDRYFRGQPPRYWWRSVFREKAGLAIAAAPAPGGAP